MQLSTTTLLLAGCASLGAIGLAAVSAVLLARGAEARDIGDHMAGMLRGAELRGAAGGTKAAGQKASRSMGHSLLQPIIRLGEILRDSALISGKDQGEFQRIMTAAGLNPGRAVPIFLAAKALLLVLLPLGAVGAIFTLGLDFAQGGMMVAIALYLVVMAPNWVVGLLRRPFQKNLRRGLPDALDLMVVAAEAGLGLESAVDRVAREMVGSNRAIALEFNMLVQELRLLPERGMALERMAERTGMEGFKRLSATLSQTLRYGTPLAQALRVLASEMRQDRQLRLEEKAMRLPSLLIGPLILFILPALFIALIGPSILEIGNTLGGSP